MGYSDWLIGSITIPAQNFTVGATPVSVAAGTYYLRHATDALSLMEAFEDALTAGGVAAAAVNLRENRLVYATGSAFTVTWGTATQLRDLLGYTDNLASATTQPATNVSPLLWSAGFPGTPTTVRGTEGYIINHEDVYVAEDGSQVARDEYGEVTWQELTWASIVVERMRSTDSIGSGTYHEFFEQVLKKRSRFFWYLDVFENDGGEGAAVFDDNFGPYVVRSADPQWYRRNVPNADLTSPLEIEMARVDEAA